MRELVLNHASLAPTREHESLDWLGDLAEGIAALVGGGVTRRALRMCRSANEIKCDGRSLREAYLLLLKRGGRAREGGAYLLGLSTKTPLLSGVAWQVQNRFLMCETEALPQENGAPLLFCALTDAIAVSVPSAPAWDRDRVRVEFLELLPDETFGHADEEIDNLARSVHAGPIRGRHRERLLRQCSDSADLWSRRARVFPALTFGPDVEGHLARLNAGLFGTLLNRLADLDESARVWAADGGGTPPWTTLVTAESNRTMNNPKLRGARRFRSASGERVLFEWHARFGSGGRIHLRFDGRTRVVEIGYIGGHLPLARR